MKKLLVALLGAMLVLGLVACGGDDNDTPAPDNAGDSGSYDLANGEEVYQQTCAACHGGDASGLSGPAIAGMTFEDVLSAIEEGPGTMPADLTTGDDANDVSAWVADQ